jgi:hypothetical protein
VELPSTLAAVVPLDLLRRPARDVVGSIDRSRLLAHFLLDRSEGLEVRRLAGVAVVNEGGFAM